MALELDGKPFSLSQELLTKYSKKMVFRVGRQYVRQNFDPELKPFDVAPVHVMPQYRHHTLVGKNKTPQGLLVYFEVKNWVEERKQYDYTPARIPIEYKGYIESTDPELNFFLDNHPANEKVKMDSNHPNFDARTQTYFATYRKEDVRDKTMETIQLQSELAMQILQTSSTSESEIKAIAELVYRQAPDYSITHRLHNIPELTDKDMRAELARLCRDFPFAMRDIISSKNVDYIEVTNKLIDADLIKNVNGSWVMMKNKVPGEAIMKIPQNQDSISALVDWFKNFDNKQTKFRKLKEALAQMELEKKKAALATQDQ